MEVAELQARAVEATSRSRTRPTASARGTGIGARQTVGQLASVEVTGGQNTVEFDANVYTGSQLVSVNISDSEGNETIRTPGISPDTSEMIGGSFDYNFDSDRQVTVTIETDPLNSSGESVSRTVTVSAGDGGGGNGGTGGNGDGSGSGVETILLAAGGIGVVALLGLFLL